jgi:hypothetical protein
VADSTGFAMSGLVAQLAQLGALAALSGDDPVLAWISRNCSSRQVEIRAQRAAELANNISM